MRIMFNVLAAIALSTLSFAATTPVWAQDEDQNASADATDTECGGYYVIQQGDTLATLAARYYGNSSDWSLIYYANFGVLSGSSLLREGVKIRIPCGAAAAEATAAPRAAATAPSRAVARSANRNRSIQILTADGNRPFTDRSLPAGGMVTELIDTAFNDAEQKVEINWINDWSAHIDPLLGRQFFDMGFPWLKPDCEQDKDNELCRNFIFSDPLFETLIVFFVRNDSEFTFSSDEEIVGRRICRPAGYPTHDFDEDGRNWLKDDTILLLRPQNVSDCFDMLMRGVIDAVSVNEFLGRQTIADMDLTAEVSPLPRAVSTQTLHVIIQRTNPRATVTLYKLNEALEKMYDSGVYQEIVAKHLAGFWQDNQ